MVHRDPCSGGVVKGSQLTVKTSVDSGDREIMFSCHCAALRPACLQASCQAQGVSAVPHHLASDSAADLPVGNVALHQLIAADDSALDKPHRCAVQRGVMLE